MVITPHRVGRARCTASSMEPLSGKESGCFFSRMWHGRLQACRSGLKRTSMKDHPTVLVSEVLCNQVHSGIYRLRFHPGLPPKKPQGINGGHTSTRNPLSVCTGLGRRCCRQPALLFLFTAQLCGAPEHGILPVVCRQTGTGVCGFSHSWPAVSGVNSSDTRLAKPLSSWRMRAGSQVLTPIRSPSKFPCQ